MGTDTYPNYKWLSELPAHVRDAVRAKQITKTYKTGEFLYHQVKQINYVYEVASGRIEICNFDPEGEQFTVGLLKQGECCGEISILLERQTAYSCFAKEDSEVNLLSRRDFLELIETYPEINQKLLVKTSKLLRMFMDRSTIASRSQVRDRLVWLLLWLRDSSGVQTAPNQYLLENLKLVDLYRMLGTARQTLSREFQALVAEGIVQQQQSNIIILDSDKLKKVSAEAECFIDELG